jgi:hypothetical protein
MDKKNKIIDGLADIYVMFGLEVKAVIAYI